MTVTTRNKDMELFYDWSAHIRHVLLEAGFNEGRRHRGGGWSDWGAPPYEEAVSGFLVEVRRFRITTGYPFVDKHKLTVDHTGAGRGEALKRYATALEERGLLTSYEQIYLEGDLLYNRRGKQFLVVEFPA